MLLYLGDAPGRLADIRGAMQRGDAHAMSEAAHALKSGSGNVGAMPLHALCQQVESLGRAGTVDGAEALVRDLEREFARVERRLRDVAGI